MRIDLRFEKLDLSVLLFFQKVDKINDIPKERAEYDGLTAVMQVVDQITQKGRIYIVDFIE